MRQPREPLSNDDIDFTLDALKREAGRNEESTADKLSMVLSVVKDVDAIPDEVKRSMEHDLESMKLNAFESKRERHDRAIEIMYKLLGLRPVDGKAKKELPAEQPAPVPVTALPPPPPTETTVSPLVLYAEIVRELEKAMSLLDEGKSVDARIAIGALRDKVKGRVIT